MGDSKASKNNLARIRDNQRRSRARRKEYLQELEAKHRTCQQLGIEASAEVQAAARRVLDENKRLRALLKERGVFEAEVNAYLNAASHESQSQDATTSLMDLLGRRLQYRTEPTSATSDWSLPDLHSIGQISRQHNTSQYRTPSLHNDNTRCSSPHSNCSPISCSDAQSTYSQFSPHPSEDFPTEPGTFPHLTYQYDLAPNCPWPASISGFAPQSQSQSQSQSQLGYASSLSRVPSSNLMSGTPSDVGANLETTLACTQAGLQSLNTHTSTSAFDLESNYHHHRSYGT